MKKLGIVATLGLATIWSLSGPIQAQTPRRDGSSRATSKTTATAKSAAAARTKPKGKTEADKTTESKQAESKGKTKMEIATFAGG